jgi:hypothetical protein
LHADLGDDLSVIARRRLIIGCASLAGCSLAAAARHGLWAAAIPSGNDLSFRIMRKGSVIGSHHLEFKPEGDGLTVRIAVEIVVKFGPIALYRYVHRNMEHWEAGKLVEMAAETNDDGAKNAVRLRRRSDEILVESANGASYVAPPNAIAATHWNMAELSVPMINPQNGQLLQPTVTKAEGDGPGGHFVLSGDVDLELWYDRDQTWSALAFKADDGSIITYERVRA